MNKEASHYQFFFVGGSGGSFAKVIFFYYLAKLQKYSGPVFFKINPDLGDCHINTVGGHYHYIKDLDLSKEIVLIDFDDDDIPYITKMAFYKVLKATQLQKDPEFLKREWPHLFSTVDSTDYDTIEKILLDNPECLIFSDWKDQLLTLTPILVIKFKDIMFGELNEIIANFFQTSKLSEVDKFIEEYRAANKKYLT